MSTEIPYATFDRFGLVNWSCNLEMFSGGEIGGGGAVAIDCKSECNSLNKRLKVHLTAAVAGITFGVPVSWSITNVDVEDGANTAIGANLTGLFEIHTYGIALIAGCGETDVKIGKASGKTGFGCSWLSGINAGFDNFWGHAELGSELEECCK